MLHYVCETVDLSYVPAPGCFTEAAPPQRVAESDSGARLDWSDRQGGGMEFWTGCER